MNILFIGDIVGKKGREAVHDLLPFIRQEYDIDFTIANAENSAHGKGITYKIYQSLIQIGVDCITLGNHAFSKKEMIDHLEQMDRLITPLNYINGHGNAYREFIVNNLTVGVTNVLGSAMMNELSSDPFVAMQGLLQEHDPEILICDFHAEATAEKILFAKYFQNKISAVIGTHTHVQTADECIFEKTAYISDVGMCGPYDSIIGRSVSETIRARILNEKTRYEVAETDPVFCAVVLKFEDNIPKAIERIQIRP